MKMRWAFPGLLGSHQEQVLTLSKPCFLSTPEPYTGRAIGTHGKAKLITQHRHMGKLQTPARRQVRPPREEEALLLDRAFQKWMCTVGNFLSPDSPGLEDYLVRDMWGGNRVGTEIKLLKIPFKL